MATTGCRASPISSGSAAPSTNSSTGTPAHTRLRDPECEPLISQKGYVEIEFGIERPLDVVGSAEPVLLAVEQQKEKRNAPLPQRFHHLLRLLRRNDPVLGSLKK